MIKWHNPDGTVVLVPERATIGEGAIIGKGATIGKGAIIEERAFIGERATILPNIVVPLGLNGTTFCCCSFQATVNDDKIVIGCLIKTINEWMMVTSNEAVGLGLPGHLYGQYRAFVQMVRTYRKERDK